MTCLSDFVTDGEYEIGGTRMKNAMYVLMGVIEIIVRKHLLAMLRVDMPWRCFTEDSFLSATIQA